MQDKTNRLFLIAYQMAVLIVCFMVVGCKSGMTGHRSMSPFKDLILRPVVETNSTGEVSFHLVLHNDSAKTVELPPALFVTSFAADLFIRRYVSRNGVIMSSNPWSLTWENVANALVTLPRGNDRLTTIRKSVLAQSDLKIATYGSHELDGDGECDFWAELLLPDSVWLPGDLMTDKEIARYIVLRSSHIRWNRQDGKIVWRLSEGAKE